MRLAVVGDPVVIAPRVLPEHRTVRVTLRNDGEDPVEVPAAELTLLDEHGASLRAHVTPKRLAVMPGAATHLDFVYRHTTGDGRPATLEVAGEPVELVATSARRA